MGAKAGQKRKPYTSEEIQFIVDNAETMFFANIGRILGRSKASIKNIARKLNLSTTSIKTRSGNRIPKKQDLDATSKICTKCKENKIFSEFNKAKFGKYGLRAICRSCQAIYSIVYLSTYKEEISERGKKYRRENKERISIQRATRTLKDKGKFTEYRKQWAKNNPGKVNAKTARRRAARRNAIPKWLTPEHHKQMEMLYVEAARLTKETSIRHEVDHIVPLQGLSVKGLHVPWNLRIITQTENRHKSRKF